MTPAHAKTHAIAVALADRLTHHQLDSIREDLDARWCDDNGAVGNDAPFGADVLMLAINDACAIAAAPQAEHPAPGGGPGSLRRAGGPSGPLSVTEPAELSTIDPPDTAEPQADADGPWRAICESVALIRDPHDRDRAGDAITDAYSLGVAIGVDRVSVHAKTLLGERDALRVVVERLTRERDEAVAEVRWRDDWSNSIADRMPEGYDGDETQEQIISRWIDDVCLNATRPAPSSPHRPTSQRRGGSSTARG